METTRQTQSYLRNLFAQQGIAPRRALGQNFLIDLNLHDLIVKTAEVGAGDVILEIGPGAGALTSLMAARGAAVVAVEIDPAMARLTGAIVAGMSNVRVLNIDALKTKNLMNPEVLDNVRSALAASKAGGGRGSFKLVANLPYNVATPVISNLLIHPEVCPSRMVVTIQRELADRMAAEPNTSDYSSLSVTVQALANIAIVRILPPSVFWPPPKVDSAIVAITPDPAARAAIGDVPWFHQVVRRTFLHRRKNLRHVLAGIWKGSWDKAEVGALLESLGFEGNLRAEALNVEEFVAIANALKERWGQFPDGTGGTEEVDGALLGEGLPTPPQPPAEGLSS
jgi:16S rRNA (adenine1518-N6/adenine1519-N6)-dimethyltransferase